jgi:hypothetical protein
LLGLFFNPEDGDNVLPECWITCCYVPEDRILQFFSLSKIPNITKYSEVIFDYFCVVEIKHRSTSQRFGNTDYNSYYSLNADGSI